MFVLYNFSAPNYKPRYFETERGARIAQGRNNNNPAKMKCGVLSFKAFDEMFGNEKVTVKNLMTGKPVEIDAGTPWCCNPASEAYWSM
jgi:hypothetical protein